MRFLFYNLLSKLARWWPVIIIILVEIILFVANFKPHTFLMGWDNVMPEFNFKTNLIRSIFGVWQEHRGVGLYDGMSHIANLPHSLFLWLLSFVLPIQVLRYVFTFLMHATGGMGMFFLVKKLLQNPDRHPGLIQDQMLDKISTTGEWIPLLASLFYLFNLATIQMFYTPLEAFSVHFAAIPWLALTILNYLGNGSKGSLTAFFFTTLISTPQYFVPTLLLPTGLLLSVILGVTLLNDKTKWKPILATGLGFLVINAFWLFPYLYGLPRNAPIIAQAKINQMSSGEAFARNQAFGDLKNVLLMRGFSLDFEDMMPDGTYTYLMAPWRSHLNNTIPIVLAWFLTGVTILGIVATIRKPYRHLLPFTILFLIAFIFLGNDIPILREATSILRTHFPLLGEALRFPFTKFSLLFVFSGSILLGLGCASMKKLKNIFVIFCIIAIGFIAIPAFQGNFIYKNLRVNLPSEYLSLFAFMQTQDPNGRITLLPQPSYWSWKFYRFGYRGSGFVWYGLNQPVMDRAFDPWSAQNENYYWELTRALYSKNGSAVEQVFAKYDIRYILLDENLISTSHDRSLFTEETKELLAAMPKIKPLTTIGKLTVYERITNALSFIAFKDNLPTVSPIYKWTDNDVAFADVGDYISEAGGDVVYPFRSLFTKRSVNEREFTLVQPKEEDLVFDTATQSSLLASSATKCGLLRPGTMHAINQDDTTKSWLRLMAADQRACVSFGANISHKDGYVVKVESRHVSGRPLIFSLINDTAKHVEVETYLSEKQDWQTSSFILPPLAPDGLGYTVYLSNDAIGKTETVNDISRIRMYKIPYNDLVNLSSRDRSDGAAIFRDCFACARNDISVSHPNPAFYQIKLNGASAATSPTLILDQAFDPGWIAWDGKQFLPHVLVNNWANAWLEEPKSADQAQHEPSTNSSEKANAKPRRRWIVIFFLPQLLEWIGFALLPLPFLAIILYDRNVWQRHPRQQKYHKPLKVLPNKLPKILE